jgi:AraC-like DNA-binding protein
MRENVAAFVRSGGTFSPIVQRGLSHSARFIRPFARLLAGRGGTDLPEPTRSGRVSAERADAFVREIIAKTGDETIGLKAGRSVQLGMGGILEYAMRSAPSLRAATQLAGQHSRLFSDTIELTIESHEQRAAIRLDERQPTSRAIGDFIMAAWYVNHIKVQLADAPDLECWFRAPEPTARREYEDVFGRARLRFGAAFNGFVFETAQLDAPLETANPVLHAFLCGQLAAGVNELTSSPESPQQLRHLIAQQLPTGALTLHSVANAVHLSPRTLARRLEAAGTTFSAELDQLRHKLALEYVARSSIPLAQVPPLLGFAHVTSFYRNFKRWTKQTPLEYRRKHAT